MKPGFRTYRVTLSDGSGFTVVAKSNADARSQAREYLIYDLGMEKWLANSEKLSVKLLQKEEV